jgi:hypothetical protein
MVENKNKITEITQEQSGRSELLRWWEIRQELTSARSTPRAHPLESHSTPYILSWEPAPPCPGTKKIRIEGSFVLCFIYQIRHSNVDKNPRFPNSSLSINDNCWGGRLRVERKRELLTCERGWTCPSCKERTERSQFYFQPLFLLVLSQVSTDLSMDGSQKETEWII